MPATAQQQWHYQRAYTGSTTGSSLSVSWSANSTDLLVFAMVTPVLSGSITSSQSIAIYQPTGSQVAFGVNAGGTIASGVTNPWSMTTPGYVGSFGITAAILVYVKDASTNNQSPQGPGQQNPYIVTGVGTTAAGNAAIIIPKDNTSSTNYQGFKATLTAFGYANSNGPGIWSYAFGQLAYNTADGVSLPANCPLYWYFLFGDNTIGTTGRATIGNFTEPVPSGAQYSTVSSNNSITPTNVLVNLGPTGSPALAIVEVRPPITVIPTPDPANNPVWIN